MEIIDSRLGRRGRGVFIIPLGLMAIVYYIYIGLGALLTSEELQSPDSLKLKVIVLVLVLSVGFFILVFLRGIRILLQTKRTLQRISFREKIKLKPFCGGSLLIDIDDINSINKVKKDKSWLLMTLLSRNKENYLIELHNRRRFLVNGEISGIEKFLKNMKSKNIFN